MNKIMKNKKAPELVTSCSLGYKTSPEKFLYLLNQKEKYSCFRKCGGREKSSPGRPQYFFNQFNGIFEIKFTLKEPL